MDRISEARDFRVTTTDECDTVWCYEDGAPQVIAGIIFTFRDATQEQRLQWLNAARMGGCQLQSSVGQVRPGEVEGWIADGYMVVCDCPIDCVMGIMSITDIRVEYHTIN